MMEAQKEKVMLFWDGGLKCALALKMLKNNPNLDIVGLITIINAETNTIPFYGISDALLINQSKLLKFPVQRIYMPNKPSNEMYISKLNEVLIKFLKKGIRTFAFSDVNLVDVREFRENIFKNLDLKILFPLWERPTKEIATEFLADGYKALVTAIDQNKLDKSFLNCEYNQEFLDRLPVGIDPIGVNGEFHSFVIFDPTFKTRVAFSKSIAMEEGPYLVSLLKEP